jgi:hypothetical protein
MNRSVIHGELMMIGVIAAACDGDLFMKDETAL